MPGGRISAFAGTWLLAALILVSGASPAFAHASFVEARPLPGVGLPRSPEVVVLRFTEPLNYGLTSVRVFDASGAEVTVGAAVPVQGDRHALQRRLTPLPRGSYTVRWTSVSTVDGHALRGTYTFGVGNSTTADEHVIATPLASEGIAGLAGRLVGLAGLVLWVGSALLGPAAAKAGVSKGRLRRLARAGPLLTLTGTALSLVASSWLAGGSPAAVFAALAGQSGRWRAALVLTAALAGLAGPSSARLGRALALLAVLAEAASGHAAASRLPFVAVGSFAVHLGAAAVWLYALLVVALSGGRARAALGSFAPAAAAAALLVGVTGTANAVLEGGSPGQFVSSGYGRAALGKAAAFLVMVVLGSLGWALGRRTRRGSVHRVLFVRAELAAGAMALVLATVMVGYPDTPGQDSGAEGGLAAGLGLLAEREAVSIAEASGEFIVGLSLLPPRPGPVVARVHVLGVEPGDGLRAARLSAVSEANRASAELEPCGLGCFQGQVEIPSPGSWQFSVDLVSNRGPVSLRANLPLPAPSGQSRFIAANAAMQRLHSAQMRERLRATPASEPLISHYRFAEPDSMAVETQGGSALVVIDDRSWSRPDPASAWKIRQRPDFSWPDDYFEQLWGDRDAEAVRVLGREEVDGVATTVVSLVRPVQAAWFRLWVGDEDGRVRRVEMLAEGHLMEQIYDGFDEPVEIPSLSQVMQSPGPATSRTE